TTQHRRSKFQPTNTLGLTICPTLNCNFRCTYCYQHHLKGVMRADVRNRIAAYVAASDGLQDLHVTWFGGEPLLAMTVVEGLSERFLAGPHRYSASIVTNGSRLTPAHSRRLVELNVTRAQITLDGPRDLHDQRRPLAGGAPTFDAI